MACLDSLPDLVPPRRWALVDDGISRGAYPLLRNYNFLRRLRLKTIISLVPDDPIIDLVDYCETEGVKLLHIRADKYKGEPTLLPNDCTAALEVLLNTENHPVYMHCLDGRQITGHVVMLLRKLVLWNHVALSKEFAKFTRESANKEELAFVEAFTGPLSLPSPNVVPRWASNAFLDAEGRPKKHPTIRVRFAQAWGPPKEKDALAAAASTLPLPQQSPAPTSSTDAVDGRSLGADPLSAPAALEIGGSIAVGLELYALNVPTNIADVSLRLRGHRGILASGAGSGAPVRGPQGLRRYSTNSIRGKPRDESSPR